MATARIVRAGKSQFVVLPEEIRLKGDRVDIYRRGGDTILREVSYGSAHPLDIPVELPIDAFEEIADEGRPRKRKRR